MNDLALPKRKLPWGIAVAAIIAVAAAAYFFIPAAKEAPKLTTVKVDKGDITVRVTATGTLSALVTVQVGSQVSGRLQDILVDFNSPVKKGQVIARLDRQLLDAALAEAQANNNASVANVERSKVKAQDAQRQFERAKELSEKKLIAASDLEAAELALHVAQADVTAAGGALEQSKAALQRAQINLGYATIISPIDGVVISRAVDVGQTVAASLSAPTLFIIAQDLKQMQVDTSVGEADIGKITPGMMATFTVDAWPGEHFTGKVRQIRNAPQTVQNVVTYDVIIDVDNPELRLRPGMTANAAFIVDSKTGVTRVPNAALRFHAPKSFRADKTAPKDGGTPGPDATDAAAHHHKRDGADAGPDGAKVDGKDGKAASREVWVLKGTTPTSVRIHTGVSDGSMTELIDGDLHDGDDVITDAIEAGGASPTNGPAASPAGGPPGGMPRRLF